ncbi:MAG: hypothetical protein WBC91_14205 [Phototrophicaceae bacterium]
MTIKVKWLIENHVMLSQFSEMIDSEQIIRYLDKSMAMRDEANEANGKNGVLIHTITDTNGVTRQNLDLKTLRQIMKSLRQQRVGWSLQVSTNAMDRFMSSMAHQFGGIRYQSFTTMDEAIDFLRKNEVLLEGMLHKGLDFSFPDDV